MDSVVSRRKSLKSNLLSTPHRNLLTQDPISTLADAFSEEEQMKQEHVVIPLHRPKPSEMIFFFSCGVIMSVPITLFIIQLLDPLTMGLDPFYATLVSTTFFSPFVEEFSKVFPLFYRHGETQRSIFNLAVMVGLGFAIVELITYVVVVGVPWYFRLPGLFFHPAATSISAYGIATKRPVQFYAVAVALHFTNNFLAAVNPFPVSVSIFVVALTVFVAWKLNERIQEKIIV